MLALEAQSHFPLVSPCHHNPPLGAGGAFSHIFHRLYLEKIDINKVTFTEFHKG